MAKFKTPGIYTEENTPSLLSINEIPTSIPAFLGYTQKTCTEQKTLLNAPQKINSYQEFQSLFTIDSEMNRGVNHYLDQSIKLYFKNGGLTCYIVSIGDFNQQPSKDDFISGLDSLDNQDDVRLYVLPDSVLLNNEEMGEIQRYALKKCSEFPYRFCILDTKSIEEGDGTLFSIRTFRDNIGSENLKFGAAYSPWLKISISNQLLEIPPSGAIAGVFCQTDKQKGIWKAPANVALYGVTGLSKKYTDFEQEFLNFDLITGKSVNSIRKFSGKGILVWGARTLTGNDNEWKYVNVVRFQNHIISSIYTSFQNISLESNDANLWNSIKLVIESYLNSYWRKGALQGLKPQEAYFVKCGLDSTMTQQDIMDGKLIIQLGLAVIRPGEFNISQLQFQMTQP